MNDDHNAKIEFSCGNVLGIAEDGKQYDKCEAKLRVNESLGGKQITCPRCKQQTEVPLQLPINLEPSLGQSADQATLSAENDLLSPENNLLVPKNDLLLATTPLPSGTTLNHRSFTRENMCQSCGATIQVGLIKCPECNTPLPADLRPDEGIVLKHKRTGFQLWFSKLFNAKPQDGLNTPLLLVNIGFILTFIILSVLLALTSWIGLAVSFLLLATIVLYGLTIAKWRDFQRETDAKLYFWQRWIWIGLLKIFRYFEWKGSLSNGKSPVILDLRESEEKITDDQLVNLPNLGSSDILDLSEQPITDKGLRLLEQRKHLSYIILIDTDITHQGMFRLQQAIPKAYIWF